jgi:hypothetical protein
VLRTARRAKDVNHFKEDPDMYVFQQHNALVFTFSLVRRYVGYRYKKPVSDIMVANTLEGYGATRAEVNGISVWKLVSPSVVNSDISYLPEQEAF